MWLAVSWPDAILVYCLLTAQLPPSQLSEMEHTQIHQEVTAYGPGLSDRLGWSEDGLRILDTVSLSNS